jgi:hypothetical protein
LQARRKRAYTHCIFFEDCDLGSRGQDEGKRVFISIYRVTLGMVEVLNGKCVGVTNFCLLPHGLGKSNRSFFVKFTALQSILLPFDCSLRSSFLHYPPPSNKNVPPNNLSSNKIQHSSYLSMVRDIRSSPHPLPSTSSSKPRSFYPPEVELRKYLVGFGMTASPSLTTTSLPPSFQNVQLSPFCRDLPVA